MNVLLFILCVCVCVCVCLSVGISSRIDGDRPSAAVEDEPLPGSVRHRRL